jgi:hypothetical protein
MPSEQFAHMVAEHHQRGDAAESVQGQISAARERPGGIRKKRQHGDRGLPGIPIPALWLGGLKS